MAVVLDFVEPAADVVEGVALGDIVHKEGGDGAGVRKMVPFVVGAGDGLEGLLAGLGNSMRTVSQIWILMVRSLMIVFLDPNSTPRVGS